MKLILDAGALVALERGDRRSWRHLKGALLASEVPLTHGGVVGQVWRGSGPRQALLAKALAAIEIRPLDEALGRSAGELLAKDSGSDVIDAAVVLLAQQGGSIVTSDPDDIERLVVAARLDVDVIAV